MLNLSKARLKLRLRLSRGFYRAKSSLLTLIATNA
jgi:hypothetical protein